MNLEKFTDRAKGFLQAAQTVADFTQSALGALLISAVAAQTIDAFGQEAAATLTRPPYVTRQKRGAYGQLRQRNRLQRRGRR